MHNGWRYAVVFIYGLKERIMNTKDFLKTELDKIDKNAYYEIDGYGNIEFICKVMELYADVVNKNAVLPHVSNRFSPEQMAEWFHNNYEEIAKAEGWQTQDKCKVEFKDLPESNRTTMTKVCERWLNGC